MILWKPITEWAVWIAIVAILYSQIGSFDKEIAEYAFGATGWPLALCVGTVLGATGQLAYQVLSRSGESAATDDAGSDAEAKLTGLRWLQRIAIFALPLLYLYLVPYVGFYLATPIFIVLLLLILEVKSPAAVVGVTVVVYGLVLFLFTRFFFVALPTGRITAFYDINNSIIGLARAGM